MVLLAGGGSTSKSLWSVKPTEHLAYKPTYWQPPTPTMSGNYSMYTYRRPDSPTFTGSYPAGTGGLGAGWLPVQGRISQQFGVSTPGSALGWHTGLDIAAPAGTPVSNAMAGTVIFSGYSGSYGYTVKVRHTDGSIGLYAHLSRLGVAVGQQVGPGAYLGAVGSSGNSTGPHLHWEIRRPGDVHGQQYNPLEWVAGISGGGGTSSFTGYQGGPLSLGQLKGVAMQAGFSEGMASIMAAIAMAESSGNPRAHNPRPPDNSYGLWQINMLGAMGPERLRWFGLSNNNQLFDPLTNAKAAFAIYQAQGLRAWSVYSSGRYLNYLGAAQAAAPASVSGGSYGGTGLDYLTGLASRATPEQLAGGAGFSVAFFKSDPELWSLLQRALNEGWDAANLDAAVKQSAWYRSHSDADRRALALQTSDPATYNRMLEEYKDRITRLAAEVGGQLSADEVAKLARLAFHGDWTDGKITSFLVDQLSIEQMLARGEELGGTAGELQDTLDQMAAQYGIKVNDATIGEYAAKMLKGLGTPQDFLAFVQKQAKAMYPHLADEIDSGYTLIDLATPYIQAASQLLEQSPDAISLDSPFVQDALKGDGDTMMSLQQFQENVRRSDDWQTTNNARNAYDTFGREILKNFGFAF